MAQAHKVLITFDVDGTLIKSYGPGANVFHKTAFSVAFKEVFGVDTHIDVINHHGCTDPQVATRTLLHAGLSQEAIDAKLQLCMDAMVRYAVANGHTAGEGLLVLPGVLELLQALSKEDSASVALVTGNLQPIAWLKMEALGIRAHFSPPGFGGFGSDHFERGELVKIAAQRAADLNLGPFTARWHVGDTPADIQAAAFGGARALGVCTGVFSAEELTAAAGGDATAVILPGLEDTRKVMELFGLGGGVTSPA